MLRQWADMEPEQPALSDGGWQVRLWENPVFECGPAAAAPEEAAVQERRYDLSAMELRYGHTAACTIPTKVTATQLKGRVLDEEIAEGAASARPRRLDFQRPLFLQQERRLTAAERGTAMHLVMQYLELDGPDPEEQVRQLTERRLLTPQQAEAVDMERIRAFLATPLAQEIRQARQVWREYRFALLMPAALYDPAVEGEELMLQGVVDCAFRTEEACGGGLQDRPSGSRRGAAAGGGVPAPAGGLCSGAGAGDGGEGLPQGIVLFLHGRHNKFVNLQKVLAFCDEMWYHHSCLCERGLLYQKEVNQSNEGRNPSQLSADYYQMRLR